MRRRDERLFLCAVATWAQLALGGGLGRAESAPERPTVGAPRVDVLSADAQRTVLRIAFPFETVPGTAARVEDLQWRRPGPVVRTARGDSALSPTASALLALPTSRPRVLVTGAAWSIPPAAATDPAVAVRLDPVRTLRGVPVAALVVDPLAGGGLLAEITVAVDHAPSGESARALAAGTDGVGEAGDPFGAAAVLNPALYAALARGRSALPDAAADKDVGHPFLQTTPSIPGSCASTAPTPRRCQRTGRCPAAGRTAGTP